MTPRLRHALFVLFTALLLSAFVMPHSAIAAERPNIVLLLTDDHPWNEYGFMGSKVAHTPNIERLASQSLRFPQGYVTAPVCRPSLSTILTGRYPHETGIVFNASPRQKEDNNAAHLITKWPTLPGLLQRAGYASLQTGKHWEADYQTAGFTEGTSAYTAAFFKRFRDLAFGAWCTTPEGMKAIGYVGNAPSGTFDGPPPEALKHVGLA